MPIYCGVRDVLGKLGLGQGIYSVPEASLYTGVDRRRISRWLREYRHAATTKTGVPHPLIAGDFEFDRTQRIQLSFRDLIEVRFVDAFLRVGVSWPELRGAANQAAALLKCTHPFSTHQFRTDGKSIFAEVTRDSPTSTLERLRTRQQVFREVVEPLFLDLEIDDNTIRRWLPLGKKRTVMLDPQYGFGLPVSRVHKIPTLVLSNSAEATSIKAAARWYEVDEREVRDAVTFEKQLARKQAA